MNDFGKAPVRGEGQFVSYGGDDSIPPKPKYDTTYVERVVPRELEDEAHELISNWLKAKGYKLEDL